MTKYNFNIINNEIVFEKFVNDLMKIIYNDKTFMLYGRKGQKQYGIDSLSYANNKAVIVQCKHKNFNNNDDNKLIAEFEKEFKQVEKKLKYLKYRTPKYFFLFSTYPTSTKIQDKAKELTDNSEFTVLYYGWDTINEELNNIYNNDNKAFFDQYYPNSAQFLINDNIHILKYILEKNKCSNEDLEKVNKNFYKINNSDEILLQIISNKSDIKNNNIENFIRKIDVAKDNTTIWLLGNSGIGKTTFLYQTMRHYINIDKEVFYLNLENNIKNIDTIFEKLKSINKNIYIFINNPFQEKEILKNFIKNLTSFKNAKLILCERTSRYKMIKESTINTQVNFESDNTFNLKIDENFKKSLINEILKLFNIEYKEINHILNDLLNDNINIVEMIYKMFSYLNEIGKINYMFDWDEYDAFLTKNDLYKFKDTYKYIAILYSFGIKINLDLLCKIKDIDSNEKKIFINLFKNLFEPIIIEEIEKECYEYEYYLKTKHEIIANLFFEYKKVNNIDKNKILMEIIRKIDLDNKDEKNILIKLFCDKQIIKSNTFIDYEKIYEYLFKNLNHNCDLINKLKLGKAWLLSKNKRYKEAIDYLEDISNKNDLIEFELAILYVKNKDYNKAEKILITLINKDKTNYSYRTEMAKLFFRKNTDNDYKKAKDLLQGTLEHHPNHLQSITEFIKVSNKLKDFNLAKEYASKGLKIDDTNLYIMSEYVNTLCNLKEYNFAYKEIDNFLNNTKLNLYKNNDTRFRKQQPLFNNIFKLCKEDKNLDKINKYYQDNQIFLDEKNKKLYNDILKNI